MFSHVPLMSSDQKISRIHRDQDKLENLLHCQDNDRFVPYTFKINVYNDI